MRHVAYKTWAQGRLARQRGDVETTITTARPSTAAIETGITSAPEKHAKKHPFLTRKGDGGFSRGSAGARKGDGGFNPTQIPASKGDAGFRQPGPTGVEGAGGAARPGCGAHGQQQHHRHPNFARNLSWSFFETPQKRCNSNDANSMFEQVAGELRAKLMGDGGAWSGFEATHHSNHQHARSHWCGGRRRDRRARAGFEIDHSERSSRVAISRAAGPDGARNTRGATSNTTQQHHQSGGLPPTGTLSSPTHAATHDNGWGALRHPTHQHPSTRVVQQAITPSPAPPRG